MLHCAELRVPTLPIAINVFPDRQRTHGVNQALLSQLLRLDEAVLKCYRMEGGRGFGPDMEPEGRRLEDGDWGGLATTTGRSVYYYYYY